MSSTRPTAPAAPIARRALVVPVRSCRGRLRDGLRPPLGPRALDALVLGAFLALSLLSIGRRALASPSGGTIGTGPDVQIFVWGLRWWAHWVAHGGNPFVTRTVWPQTGVDVLWTTTTPLLGVLAAPLTLTAGPVAAFNTLVVLAPALSAWAAYKLLLEATDARRPAIAGGLLFGFSSFELAESVAHLQMSMTFLVPMAAWIVLRRWHGRLSTHAAAWRLTLLCVAQFLISPELLMSLLLFGALALGTGWALIPGWRAPVRALTPALAIAVGVAVLVVAPALLIMARTMPSAFNGGAGYSADLLNLIVPTPVAELGGVWADGLSRAFPGNLAERGAYLGAPLLLVLGAFVGTRRRDPLVRWLATMFALAVLLSLGARLTVAGHRLVWLPGALLARLPLLSDALPARDAVYSALIAAAIVSLWLCKTRRPRRSWAVLAIVLVTLTPSTAHGLWWQPLPAAIRTGALARAIPSGSTVLALPTWNTADRTLLAQAVADLRFRVDDAWIQLLRGHDRRLVGAGAVNTLTRRRRTPADGRRLRRLLCAAHIQYVVGWGTEGADVARLGMSTKRIDGVELDHVTSCTAT